MAHEIEGSRFAYAEGEPTPWHVEEGGIRDNRIPTESVHDLPRCIEAAGLDVHYEKVPVQLVTDGRAVPGLFAMRRKEDDKILDGVGVGERYDVLDPKEALSFFAPFFDSKAVRFSAAGMIRDGKRYFLTATVEGSSTEEVTPGDFVRGYLVMASSMDRSLLTSINFTAVRVVCNNTLSVMVGTEDEAAIRKIRVKHTASQRATLNQIQEIVDVAQRGFTATVEQYRKLAQAPIVREDLERYVRIALDFPTEEAEQSTRGDNIVERVMELAENGQGTNLAGTRGTLWGAYNAVTEYLSHEYGRSEDARVDSLMFGVNRDKSSKALELAVSMAGSAQ